MPHGRAQEAPRPASPVPHPDAASIHVLAVSAAEENGGATTGHVSRMTLTAAALDDPAAPARLDAGPGAGSALRSSLEVVRRHITLSHGWPDGILLQLGFEDATRRHEGESFALGAALLADSLLSGVPIDENVSVTGCLKDDGTVAAAGQVRKKLEAARRAHRNIVIIPAANAEVVMDMLVEGGPAALAPLQVICVDHFAAARAISTSRKNPDVRRALANYTRLSGILAKALSGPPAAGSLPATPGVVAALDAILAAVPGHLSARFMKMHAEGRDRAVLSVGGSVRAIDRLSPAILRAAGNGMLDRAALDGALEDLHGTLPLLHTTTRRCALALRDYGELLRRQDDDDRSAADRERQLREAAARIDSERRELQRKLQSPDP